MAETNLLIANTYSSEITLKDFLLMQKKQKGELFEKSRNLDDTYLTNDSLSTEEDISSISSGNLSKKKRKKTVVDENSLTLKEIVGRRTKVQTKFGENKQNKENCLNMSKKIKKDEKNITSSSFATRQHTHKWNFEETRRFYKGLELFGTDFSMITKLFSSRNRMQIKNKFRKEEKINLLAVDECLKKHANNKYNKLVGKIRKNSYSSVDSLDKNLIEEINHMVLMQGEEN